MAQTAAPRKTRFTFHSFTGLCWRCFGLFLACLGSFLLPLGPSWSPLEPSWRQEALKNETPTWVRLGFALLGLQFGRVLAPCWCFVGRRCDPRDHGNNILWLCTSRLAPETLTWANLAQIDTIFRRFWKPAWHQKPKTRFISNG